MLLEKYGAGPDSFKVLSLTLNQNFLNVSIETFVNFAMSLMGTELFRVCNSVLGI